MVWLEMTVISIYIFLHALFACCVYFVLFVFYICFVYFVLHYVHIFIVQYVDPIRVVAALLAANGGLNKWIMKQRNKNNSKAVAVCRSQNSWALVGGFG